MRPAQSKMNQTQVKSLESFTRFSGEMSPTKKVPTSQSMCMAYCKPSGTGRYLG